MATLTTEIQPDPDTSGHIITFHDRADSLERHPNGLTSFYFRFPGMTTDDTRHMQALLIELIEWCGHTVERPT